MKKIYILLIILVSVASAKVNIVASYPYLGKIIQAVGGENVKIKVLSSSKFDPHFVIPKPSLIPAISQADLLVANGAGLEIGWLPPLLKRANNPKVRIGSEGFVDVSRSITLIDIPKAVSRAYGDVHPEGNPHFDTDPHNILPIAKLIAEKLSILDSSHADSYQNNLKNFTQKWKNFLKEFDNNMQSCKGMKVVQYHELYNYLLKRYEIDSVDTIEPLPGITPNSKHIVKLIHEIKTEGIKTILQDPYHEKKSASFIAEKTGIKVVVIPNDVGSVDGTDTLESFYNTIGNRLCH